MIELIVSGKKYSNFERAQAEIRLDSLSNSFIFDAVIPGNSSFPFNGGDSVSVLVSGEKVLTGYIEVIDISYDYITHTVSLAGRDKTADLVDSTLDVMPDFRGEGYSVGGIVEQVLEHLGLNITVIQEFRTPLFTREEDLISPEPGDNAFKFIESYAQKRQVLLTSDQNGNIVITKNQGIKGNGRLQNIISSDDNNIVSANFSYDSTGRYNLYKMASDLNPTALNFAGITQSENIVDQRSEATDTEIRATRVLTFKPPTSISSSQGENRCLWEANVRRARGLRYQCIVNGFRVGVNSGDLWKTNRLYEVVDDYVGKIEPMLCNATTFNYDRENGSTTDIEMVGANAYTNNVGSVPGTESFRAIGNESFNAIFTESFDELR